MSKLLLYLCLIVTTVPLAPNIQNVIVGFQRTEITVSENCVLEVVCAMILSNQALTQDLEVTISSIDDTAVSCGMKVIFTILVNAHQICHLVTCINFILYYFMKLK